VPTKTEKLARAADFEETEIPEYSPETARLDEQEWEKMRSQAEWQYSLAPGTSNVLNPMTPRTVAFQTLEGSPATGSNTLPFREQYGGPDGR